MKNRTSTFHPTFKQSWNAPSQRTAKDHRKTPIREEPHQSLSLLRAPNQITRENPSSQSRKTKAEYSQNERAEASRSSRARQPALRLPQPSVVGSKAKSREISVVGNDALKNTKA